MKKKNELIRVKGKAMGCAAFATLLAAASAHAQASTAPASGHTFGAQLGVGTSLEHGVREADLGFVWDPGLNWWDTGGWHFGLTGEAHLSYWHTNEGASHHDVYAFGIQPMVRFIKDQGAIRPYIEAGVGLRLLSHPTISDEYTLSTAFQFTEVVGVGAQFGAHQQYQAGFRYQHISNAGMKEPNPGINFTQLYLQYNF